MKTKILFFVILCFQIIVKAQFSDYIPNYDTVLHFAGEEISDYPLTQRITDTSFITCAKSSTEENIYYVNVLNDKASPIQFNKYSVDFSIIYDMKYFNDTIYFAGLCNGIPCLKYMTLDYFRPNTNSVPFPPRPNSLSTENLPLDKKYIKSINLDSLQLINQIEILSNNEIVGIGKRLNGNACIFKIKRTPIGLGLVDKLVWEIKESNIKNEVLQDIAISDNYIFTIGITDNNVTLRRLDKNIYQQFPTKLNLSANDIISAKIEVIKDNNIAVAVSYQTNNFKQKESIFFFDENFTFLKGKSYYIPDTEYKLYFYDMKYSKFDTCIYVVRSDEDNNIKISKINVSNLNSISIKERQPHDNFCTKYLEILNRRFFLGIGIEFYDMNKYYEHYYKGSCLNMTTNFTCDNVAYTYISDENTSVLSTTPFYFQIRDSANTQSPVVNISIYTSTIFRECIISHFPYGPTDFSHNNEDAEEDFSTDKKDKTMVCHRKIYPNPTKDILNIFSDIELTKIEIFNTLGQKVYITNANANNLKINLSNLSSGNYTVKLYTKNNVSIEKFVKE